MELSFRQATAEDTNDCIDMVYSSGPQLLDYIFTSGNKTAKVYLAFEFKNGFGFQGHRAHTVAIHNGKVVGVASFYSRDDGKRMEMETFKNLLRFYGWIRIIPIIIRSLHAKKVVESPRRNSIYIANVGVKPEMRSHGVGSALIKQAIEKAKRDGYKEMSLDVASNNPRAEALYQRLGFKFIKEKLFRNGKMPDFPRGRLYVLTL